MRQFIIITMFLLLPLISHAAVHHVTVDSTAATTQAAYDSSVDEGTPCNLRAANMYAIAGDTIEIHGGTYTYNAKTGPYGLIRPYNSGTFANRIVYKNHDATPVILTITDNYSAVALYGVSYIVVDGLNIVDGHRYSVEIWNGSHYNEIKNCVMSNVNYPASRAILVSGYVAAADYSNPSTNNWIHDNIIHDFTQQPCLEGGDVVSFGTSSSGDSGSNHNTFENNTIYNYGHTGTENFSKFNVFRNNNAHNPGFKTDITHITGTVTNGGTNWLQDDTKDFTALGITTNDGRVGFNITKSTTSWVQSGLNNYIGITSVTTELGGTNNRINFTQSLVGGNVYAAGDTYDIACLYRVDSNPPSNSKYSHRTYHIDSGDRDGFDYILFEGNRAGHASGSPGNNGADGLSLSAGSCIVRYNQFYGAAGPGLYFKNGAASTHNRVYNNTIFGNGRFAGIDNATAPITKTGVYGTTTAVDNALKNNIIYGNASQFQWAATTVDTAGNLCQSSDDWCAVVANPLFIDSDLTQPYVFTLPNLQIPSTSPARDQASHLTLTNGSGTNATEVFLDDVTYFQPGSDDCVSPTKTVSFGSCLSSIQGDWLKIGNAITQVVDINYATNKLTIYPAISWADNTEVYLYKKSDGVQVLYGSAPDIGAHERSKQKFRGNVMIGGSADYD